VRLWDTEPLRTPYQARREAAALQPEAERRVKQLWQKKNAEEAVEASRADRRLAGGMRSGRMPGHYRVSERVSN
jgi:hypothetical protein